MNRDKMHTNYYRPAGIEANVDRLFAVMVRDLSRASLVDTGHWQAKKDVAQTQTRELMNVQIQLGVSGSRGGWSSYMRPNLPWAEEHFQERVSGKPLNPPPSHVNWPYNQAGNKDHMDGQVFSHSYPERLWPRFAPVEGGDLVAGYGQGNHEDQQPQTGIRYYYGDLANAVDLLLQEPHTRQCFIPLWFPEDLHAAAVEHQRVPCTLGYHMMLRNNQLHCFYPMRSLDLLRYFRDDAYMAGRLVQWIISQCRRNSGENSVWWDVEPGILTMHAVSLHCFEGDMPIINALLKKTQIRQGELV